MKWEKNPRSIETSGVQILLTLTDGKLGGGKFITQSLVILVEDVNDNAPVFLPYPSSVSVPEHYGGAGTVIAEVEATDRDSGIFGQVRLILVPILT